MASQPTPIAQVAVNPKMQSLNPATGDLLAQFDPMGADQVRSLVDRARHAASAWSSVELAKRAHYLLALKEVIYGHREKLANLIALEAGKPLAEVWAAEIQVVLDAAQYFARHASELLAPQSIPHHNLAVRLKRGRLEYEPYGVIGIISPANYPFSIPLCDIIPALIAGNTVVLKPSELVPQIGQAIGELFKHADSPPGVVSVARGAGEAGQALLESPIDKLIFTGSVATGKKIQRAAADRLLPTVLELGGKDPMIVCEDANLDVTSSGAVWGAFTNAGQACLSIERAYVMRAVAGRFSELCAEKAAKLRLGAGSDPATDVGPLIRERQLQIVENQVAEAVAAGAKVLTGGHRASPGGLKGFFYQPTVISGVNHSMRLMREETFGPVLPIMVVEDENQAIELANDSEFGLSASVWTRDSKRGERIARSLKAGSVMVNDCVSYFGICEAPHGGVKASGLGRTHSRLGLMEMVRAKYIDRDLVPGLRKVWWYSYGPPAVNLMRGFTDFQFAKGLPARFRGLMEAVRNLRKPKV